MALLWPDPRLNTVVTVTIEPHGVDQSLLRIRHRLPAALAARHEAGWVAIAEQLELALER